MPAPARCATDRSACATSRSALERRFAAHGSRRACQAAGARRSPTEPRSTRGGGIRRGNAIDVDTRGLNEYLVVFDRSVDECVSTATLATVEGGVTVTPPAGRITVARDSGRVLVKTYDAAGNAQQLPFHLIVAC